MRLKPIQTEEEYKVMLAWIDHQFNLGVPFESPEGENLQVALLLIKTFEDAHYAIPKPDPIEAIKIKMVEKGLLNQDLVKWIGSKSYVSAILNHKKPLTLKMAKIFHHELGIPAEVLLA